MNALDLRQQILFGCGESDDDTSLQYDPGHTQHLLLRSVKTDLQDGSIRAKLRTDPNAPDEVLIQQMSAANSVEKRREKKLKNNGRSKPPTASMSAVSDDSPKDKQESKKFTP